MNLPERRRETRVHASPPAQIIRRGARETVAIVNASYRGLFVRMNVAPRTGELLKIEVELPEARVVVHGVPARIVQEASGRVGVGLRLFALNGDERRVWESFIASLLVPQQRAAA